MASIVTILTEGFADWEIGPIAGAARAFYGMTVRHAAPRALPVTSAGGLRIIPDLSLEAIELDRFDALLVCGSTLWRTDRAPDIDRLLRRAHAAGLLIGGICDGTRTLAAAGLLDRAEHTSNTPETLLEVAAYAGRGNYWDVPHAVSSQRIVTAPGTAPVSFMAEVLDGLGVDDASLEFYLGLLAAEHATRNHLPPVLQHRAPTVPGRS